MSKQKPKATNPLVAPTDAEKAKHLDRYSALTLDELFGRRDEPATEPVPPRNDVHEYIFEGNAEAASSCESVESSVRIRATGDLILVHPSSGGGERLSVEELVNVSETVRHPQAFRPKWLDIMTAPRIRPRLLDINIPGAIKPLIFESTGSEWPWSAIGKVFITRRGQKPKVGSGVLVGPRLLLTASHAMPWGTDDSSVRFVPSYRNGNDPRFGDAYVETWRGVRNEDEVTGLDYVICKLNWRIGDRTGWLGSEWHSDEDWYYNDPWISVGYPTSEPNGGERPSIEIPVWVRDIDNEADGLEIETHKFALGGWSGGPLWGWRGGAPKVVGIESGFEKDGLDPTRTVFAGGQHLVNLVKYGWANWNEEAIKTQPGWRSCPKCQGMHFAGFPNFKGVCPAGGQHEQTNSFAYVMRFDSSPSDHFQDGWCACPKCQGMHFAGFPDFKGVCPAGGQHEQTNSFAYVMMHDLDPMNHEQIDWRSCRKCQGLFFGPFKGRCPAGGEHDAADSFNYGLRFD